MPADKLKQLHYEMERDDKAPTPGAYIVSLGKQGVCSVWQIAAVRKVQHRTVVDHQCYALSVVPAPDMKPLTVFDAENWSVWVRGEPAHPLVWFPRGKR